MKEEPFLHKHIFLPRSQPLLPIQLPVLGLGPSIPNGRRDTSVGLGPRPWTGEQDGVSGDPRLSRETHTYIHTGTDNTHIRTHTLIIK